ncbi:MAG: exonuclease SbcCD subunit D C-terminal domain-containing protein, partial [Chitinispirillaceae bacterium]|nr:exonuclease SbcCD subunit D C-terminal domain-containing protein [Chitinispirillaceae bacterium]
GNHMNVLHTSDWHLGRSLYGRKRHEEFGAFLDWLVETVSRRQVDLLLVAGDVFDNGTPGASAQELYYRFLYRVAATSCRHAIVIAGNHDSPAFLNAPRELLRTLNVHVIGAVGADPDDEVILCTATDGSPEAVVCAVPYLRERDIRVSQEGELPEEKDLKLLDAVRDHYAAVVALAQRKREAAGGRIPLIVMGHLFTAGGVTIEDDGVRELYIGSLARVPTDIFPQVIDYLALGHLHVPQTVDGSDTRRYSGSPLPMGFGEAHQRKSVCLIRFNGCESEVELVAVPVFRKLERVKGGWNEIETAIAALASSSDPMWLEVVYEGDELIGDLRERLEKAVSGTGLELLRIKNRPLAERLRMQESDGETLDDLGPVEIFERRLSVSGISEPQRRELRAAYKEILLDLERHDAQDESER